MVEDSRSKRRGEKGLGLEITEKVRAEDRSRHLEGIGGLGGTEGLVWLGELEKTVIDGGGRVKGLRQVAE